MKQRSTFVLSNNRQTFFYDDDDGSSDINDLVDDYNLDNDLNYRDPYGNPNRNYLIRKDRDKTKSIYENSRTKGRKTMRIGIKGPLSKDKMWYSKKPGPSERRRSKGSRGKKSGIRVRAKIPKKPMGKAAIPRRNQNFQKKRDLMAYESNWDQRGVNNSRKPKKKSSSKKRKRKANFRYNENLSDSDDFDGLKSSTATVNLINDPYKSKLFRKNNRRKSKRAFRLDPRQLRINKQHKNGKGSLTPSKVVKGEDDEERFRIRNTRTIKKHDEQIEVPQINSEEENTIQRLRKKNRGGAEEITIGKYDGTELQLKQFLKDYIKKLEPKMTQTVMSDISKLTKMVSGGQDVRLRVWKRRGRRLGKSGVRVEEIKGIYLYMMDNSYFKCRRIKILHISTNDESKFEEWMNLCVDYTFKTDASEEIMIELAHSLDEETGKKKLWKFMKEKTKLCGFKWRMMINNKELGRCTVFGIKRDMAKYPLEKEECLEPIRSTSVTVVSRFRLKNESDLTRTQRQFKCPYNRDFILTAGILEHVNYAVGHLDYEKTSKMAMLGPIIEKIKENQKFRIGDIDHEKIQNTQDTSSKLLNIMEERSHVSFQCEEEEEKATSLTSKKFALRFKTFNVGQLMVNEYLYIRTKYTKRFILPQSFSSVYIIPTFDKEQMVFLIHITSERAKKFKMRDLIASFLNWSPEDEIDDSECGKIWIPQFVSTSPSLANDQLKEAISENTDFDLETIYTKSKVEMTYDLNPDNIEILKEEDDIIIQNDFVFGVMDLNLMVNLELPVFMTLIKKQEFIRK